MIDHLTLTVSNLERSRDFYKAVLAPLGYSLRMTFEGFLGFGDERKPYFWIKEGVAQRPMHLAFRAKTRAAVDAFHRAALKAGGKDDGAPGVRPHYHENYYGGFVLDPDGHPIEAVCHDAAEAGSAKSRKTAAESDDALGKLRILCLGLPGASEATHGGKASFTVRGKIFATFGGKRKELGIGLEAARAAALVAGDKRFRPYPRDARAVMIDIADVKSWTEVEKLVKQSYELVASAKKSARKPAKRRSRR